MTAITPFPGDASTEPVATAEQSHVAGRVGPPTIAQDAAAEHYVPAGVEQIEPGTEVPAETVAVGGPVELEGDRENAPVEPNRPRTDGELAPANPSPAKRS